MKKIYHVAWAVNVFLEDLVLVHAGNLKSRDMMLF